MTGAGEEWMALAARVLRGRDFSDVLVSRTRDGIPIQPLYVSTAGVGPGPSFSGQAEAGPKGPAFPHDAARGAADDRRIAQGWDIRQRHSSRGRDLESVRAAIREDLDNGVTSLELDVGHGGDAAGAMGRILDEVPIGRVAVALAPHCDARRAEALAGLAAGRGEALAPGSTLGLDPLGEWARSGDAVDGQGADRIIGLAARLARGGALGPGVRALTCDATRYGDAGATEAQWSAWAVATGIEYLRKLVSAGLGVEEAAGLIGFRLPATADQFVTMATLRAARIMWARVVEAGGGSPAAALQCQHAVTAESMYSRSDRWVNLLRATSAALAAGVAGAEAVTVLAFDIAGRGPAGSALSRRLARNTQLLLAQESHLARSTDPAGGSYYVESLTRSLAETAWRIMQRIEEAGSMTAVLRSGALRSGLIERAVQESWAARESALRTRKEAITGVSEFPLLGERRQAPAEVSLRCDDDGGVGGDNGPGSAGLPLRRLSRLFEASRDDADRYRADKGKPPAVWVVALGPLASRSQRTAWAQNLLAVGGIAALEGDGDGFESPVAAAAAFAASGLTAAVICGSDRAYKRRAAATARALSDGGASLVAVVGDPADMGTHLADELRQGGANEFWHHGIDVVDLIQRLHRVLGVTR